MVFATGCGGDPASATPVTTIVVTVDRGSVVVGHSVSFQARLTGADGRVVRRRRVTWTSSDPARLAVEARGESAVAEALGVGELVTVTATVGNVSGQVAVTILPVFASISPGDSRTCALDSEGVAFCWGRYDGGPNITIPKRVAGNQLFEVLASSPLLGTMTCGLTAAGAAYCWDFRNGGLPTPVGAGLAFSSLARGISYRHRCALTATGAAYCWGANTRGQLGDGTTNQVVNPPTLVTGDLVFTSLFLGDDHSCGLVSSGEAFCCGDNSNGELGDGTTTRRTQPAAVVGNLRFTVLAGGGDHTCGLAAGGTAYCWGGASGGALGNGSVTQQLTPTPVEGGITFVDITAGLYDFTCGRTSDGTAYCWGQNLPAGQLGSLGSHERLTPYPVGGGHRFTQLSAGFATTCGITVIGRAVCWGAGSNGQLGDGTMTEAAFTPVFVKEPEVP
jgi:alpha-tubulin suppressor-like RCC1 family protein